MAVHILTIATNCIPKEKNWQIFSVVISAWSSFDWHIQWYHWPEHQWEDMSTPSLKKIHSGVHSCFRNSQTCLLICQGTFCIFLFSTLLCGWPGSSLVQELWISHCGQALPSKKLSARQNCPTNGQVSSQLTKTDMWSFLFRSRIMCFQVVLSVVLNAIESIILSPFTTVMVKFSLLSPCWIYG